MAVLLITKLAIYNKVTDLCIASYSYCIAQNFGDGVCQSAKVLFTNDFSTRCMTDF